MSSGVSGGRMRLRFLGTKLAPDGKENESWNTILENFKQNADKVNGRLYRKEFGLCIGMGEEYSKEFAGELFDALARRRKISAENGITEDELRLFWEDMTTEDQELRLKIFFDMCDKNGDGKLSEEEVKQVIILSASANKLANLKQQAASHAALIMEKLDLDHNGSIELRELEPLLMVMLESEKEGMTPKEYRTPLRKFISTTMLLIHDNWKRIWVITLWLAINLGLFLWKFYQYKNKGAFQIMGHCLCFAKGAAETLKFNMALILLPICRRILTKLRSTFLNDIVPFDDHINFHKLIALAITMMTFVHVLMHLACDFPRLISCPKEKFMNILGNDFDFKQPTYLDLVRSVPGITGIIMVLVMAFAFTLALNSFRSVMLKWHNSLEKQSKPLAGSNSSEKQSKHSAGLNILKQLAEFNSFWYVHHSLALVYVLLLIHGYFLFLTHDWTKKTTWMYIVVPILLYASERTYSIFNESDYGVKVKNAIVYKKNVVALYLSKPQGFEYKSGMYLFVKCPDVSKFEWHPFSITSAPGDDYLSVHIKRSGDWTTELINRFDEACSAAEAGSDDKQAQARYPKILIKGPYGAPAQNFDEYDIVLLIGLGIGATPFISIIKDILNNIQPSDIESGSTSSSYSSESKGKGLERAYFYWSIGDQGALQWFKGVMDDIAKHDQNHRIDIHNHLTSVHGEGDARSALISMIQQLKQSEDGLDVISDSQIKTHFGRPNWRKVFSEMQNKHKSSRIGVFYCGNPSGAKDVKECCKEFSLLNSSTRFDFHKENF